MIDKKTLGALVALNVDLKDKELLCEVLSDGETEIFDDGCYLTDSLLGLISLQLSELKAVNKHEAIMSNAVETLKNILPKIKLRRIKFKNLNFAGYCVLSEALDRFICFVIFERTKGPKLLTPPNWDGSKEMLKKFNDALNKRSS
jgi:hypothetical protein